MAIPRFNAPIPVTLVWMFLLLEHASQRAENELYTHRTSVFISCSEMRLHAPMNYEMKAPTVTCTSFSYFLGITFVAPQLWVYYVAVCTVPIGLYHLGAWCGQNNTFLFYMTNKHWLDHPWMLQSDWILFVRWTKYFAVSIHDWNEYCWLGGIIATKDVTGCCFFY